MIYTYDADPKIFAILSFLIQVITTGGNSTAERGASELGRMSHPAQSLHAHRGRWAGG